MTAPTSIRSAFLTALLILSLNVNASGMTKIHFSPIFTASVPTQSLDGATFFSSDGPAIRFSSKKYLAGSIITRERDGLGPTFDLTDYPLYLFGWKDTEGLTPEEAEIFMRSHEEWTAILDGPVFESVKLPEATAYTACSHRCEVILVKDGQTEQILHLTSQGFSQADLLRILGKNDATK